MFVNISINRNLTHVTFHGNFQTSFIHDFLVFFNSDVTTLDIGWFFMHIFKFLNHGAMVICFQMSPKILKIKSLEFRKQKVFIFIFQNYDFITYCCISSFEVTHVTPQIQLFNFLILISLFILEKKKIPRVISKIVFTIKSKILAK